MKNVGIIGLGKIAAMYSTPDAKNSYCHAGGILHSSAVSLVGGADISPEAIEKFQGVWGGAFPDMTYYNSAAEMLASGSIDIAAVCVRGPDHFGVMMDVLKSDVKAVFLEKPPSCSLKQMDTMMGLASSRGIPITVSYSRHWRPGTLRMAELTNDGLIGDIHTVVGYTGNTVLSFGIHTTDLICQFSGGNPVSVYATGTLGEDTVPKGYEPEPSLTSMVIEFDNGVTGIQIGTEGEHGAFYCDVIGTAGSLRAGMYTEFEARTLKSDPIDLVSQNIPAERSVFSVAYEQIAAYLDGGKLPHCTNDAFRAVNEIGFAAVESIITGEKVTVPNRNRSRKIFANG